MVQLLHDLGADVHRAINDGTRPIHAAAQQGHDKIMLLLISLRADINSPGQYMRPPLISATIGGQFSTVRTLILARCDINRTAEGGRAAVDCPREICGDAILQLLRDYGCVPKREGRG